VTESFKVLIAPFELVMELLKPSIPRLKMINIQSIEGIARRRRRKKDPT
jgi:hypothetical protein